MTEAVISSTYKVLVKIDEKECIMTEPARSRAVLSTEDFELLREAVLHYLEVVKDKPESIKFSRLYHRLGSAMGR